MRAVSSNAARIYCKFRSIKVADCSPLAWPRVGPRNSFSRACSGGGREGVFLSSSRWVITMTQRRIADPNRHLVLGALATLPALSVPLVPNASAQTTSAQAPSTAGAGFSFAAVGDTRPMMYLPLKEGQPDLHKYFIELFDLVMPEKVAEEVVARDVKLIFDPVTKDLIKVIMLFASKTEVMTMTLDNGWVTEASVEDTKLLPGVLRTIFRLQGGEWVTREIVKDVQSGRAKFVVNSGDAVWWGNQGRTVTDSPYWKRVNETMLKKLPAPDDEMRAAGLGPTILWVRIFSRSASKFQQTVPQAPKPARIPRILPKISPRRVW